MDPIQTGALAGATTTTVPDATASIDHTGGNAQQAGLDATTKDEAIPVVPGGGSGGKDEVVG